MYSRILVVFGQSFHNQAKVVVFWEKVVVFGQKCLYSGKSGCIGVKVVVFGKVVVIEQG